MVISLDINGDSAWQALEYRCVLKIASLRSSKVSFESSMFRSLASLEIDVWAFFLGFKDTSAMLSVYGTIVTYINCVELSKIFCMFDSECHPESEVSQAEISRLVWKTTSAYYIAYYMA